MCRSIIISISTLAHMSMSPVGVECYSIKVLIRSLIPSGTEFCYVEAVLKPI